MNYLEFNAKRVGAKAAAGIVAGTAGVYAALAAKDKYIDRPKRLRRIRHEATDATDKLNKESGTDYQAPIFKDKTGRRFRYLNDNELKRLKMTNLEALDQKLIEFASLAKLTRAAESMIRKGSTKAQRGKVLPQFRHKSKTQRDHDELEVARKYHGIQTKGFRETAARSAKLKGEESYAKTLGLKIPAPEKRKLPPQIHDEKSVVNLLVRSLKHETRRHQKTKGAVEEVRSTTVRGSTGEHGRMKILGSQTKNTGKWAEVKVPKDKKGDYKIPRKNSKIVQSGREDRTGLPLKQYRTRKANKIVRAVQIGKWGEDPTLSRAKGIAPILFPATGRRKVYGRPGMK